MTRHAIHRRPRPAGSRHRPTACGLRWLDLIAIEIDREHSAADHAQALADLARPHQSPQLSLPLPRASRTRGG